jgi:hypothetical protein
MRRDAISKRAGFRAGALLATRMCDKMQNVPRVRAFGRAFRSLPPLSLSPSLSAFSSLYLFIFFYSHSLGVEITGSVAVFI